MGGRKSNDDGFIMVDALTGVVIISLMVGVCLATVKIARGLSETSYDTRASQALMQSLMEATPRVPGHYKGLSGGMSYDVQVTEVKVGNASLCQILAAVKAPNRHRVYKLSGMRWCAGQAQ